MDIEQIKKRTRDQLVIDEGKKNYAYKDHLGYLTIGVGRLIDERKGGGLSDDEVFFLLENNIQECIDDIKNEPWWLAVEDNIARACAVINMRFQLGSVGIRNFKNSLAFIAARDWKNAGINLRKSLWYKQTTNRAERVIRAIETGS